MSVPAVNLRWSGWTLNDRGHLLGQLAEAGVQLRHPVVVCDHVTLARPDTALPGPVDIAIVGVASDGRVQALVAEVNGARFRPDGQVFHVTLSRIPEAADRESKGMLREAVMRPVGPWRVATTPILRDATPD